MKKTTLDFWDRVDRNSIHSKIIRQEQLESESDIEMFEKFYGLNNRLKYCNGSYYKFQDQEWTDKYQAWLKSDDYKAKSFNLYYGGGVVD